MKKIVLTVAGALAILATSCVSLPDAARKLDLNVDSVTFANENNVEGFNVEGVTETWNDLYPNMPPKLSYVKTFVIQKVRLLFDPPTSAAVSEALNNSLSELTYRLVTDLE